MELSAREDTNRRMLRVRDEMDRRYAEPLDVPSCFIAAWTRPRESSAPRRQRFRRSTAGVPLTSVVAMTTNHDETTATQVRELVTKGALGGIFLLSDDVHATYAAPPAQVQEAHDAAATTA